jgi:hypothetical protein
MEQEMEEGEGYQYLQDWQEQIDEIGQGWQY